MQASAAHGSQKARHDYAFDVRFGTRGFAGSSSLDAAAGVRSPKGLKMPTGQTGLLGPLGGLSMLVNDCNGDDGWVGGWVGG